MKWGPTILVGVALTGCSGLPASSATIKVVPAKSGRVVIQISGRIEAGDADALINAARQANAAGKFVETIQLNSTGGILAEGARLALAIKAGKMSTSVAQGAVCASACFLAFAAGDPKFVDEGALIGVHKASDQAGRETQGSAAATLVMARFAKELGVPSGIIERMVATSPKQIVWLTPQDLRAMRVTAGKPTQTKAMANTTSIEQTGHQSASLTSAAPQAKADTNSVSWNNFIAKVTAISAQQNDGTPVISRLCKPDLKSCVMAVAYLLQDGRQGLATLIQDLNGEVVRREVCESDLVNSSRDCTDWDTGAKYRDIKNTKGDWVQVID